MNFTSESLAILVIFLGMSLISFFISLPYILKKDITLDKETSINS